MALPNQYQRTVTITPSSTAYTWDTPPSWITVDRVGSTDEWTITVAANTGASRSHSLTVRHDNTTTIDSILVSQVAGAGAPNPTAEPTATPIPTAEPTATPTATEPPLSPTATPGPSAPSVNMVNFTASSSTTLIANGNISSANGSPLTGRGFWFGDNPTRSNNEAYSIGPWATGGIQEVFNGLTPGTTYYCWAYATNAVGTTYSSVLSRATNAAQPTATPAPTGQPAPTPAPTSGSGAGAGPTLTPVPTLQPTPFATLDSGTGSGTGGSGLTPTLTPSSTPLPTFSGGGGGGGGCHLVGDLLTLANGETKAVENIVLGDALLSLDITGLGDDGVIFKQFDVATADYSDSYTNAVVSNITVDSYGSYYSINNGSLKLTHEHPVLIKTKDERAVFKNISNVIVGDSMLSQDNEWISVISNELINTGVQFTTYSFDVENKDVYFASQYLVHNVEQELSREDKGFENEL